MVHTGCQCRAEVGSIPISQLVVFLLLDGQSTPGGWKSRVMDVSTIYVLACSGLIDCGWCLLSRCGCMTSRDRLQLFSSPPTLPSFSSSSLAFCLLLLLCFLSSALVSYPYSTRLSFTSVIPVHLVLAVQNAAHIQGMSPQSPRCFIPHIRLLTSVLL